MKKPALPTLGELEIRVLRLVWRNQPCTERRITDLLQDQHPVGRTTVLKTLQRLEAKGLLAREPNLTPVRFRATSEPSAILPTLVERFVDKVLGGAASPLLAYFADDAKLSAKDLAALRAIARKLDPKDDSQP